MESPRDRISSLQDDVLGHILSFLPSNEAGQAAVLARRWRHIFGHVHTISYEEQQWKGENYNYDDGWSSDYYYPSYEQKSASAALLDNISAALLCRRRCARGHVPLRAFRFAFDDILPWDARHADHWLSYVLEYAVGTQPLHLDLSFVNGSICARDEQSDRRFDDDYCYDTDSDSDDEEQSPYRYRLPGKLFSCAALKTLCLSRCRMKLPAEVNLPCLETLRLTGIRHDSGISVQRLVLSCPRLADLTLEAVHHLITLSVLDRSLRRFVLRCCHNAQSIHIDASELRSLEYRGAVPLESILTLHGAPTSQGILSCTVDVCTPVTWNVAEHAAFRQFMWSFAASRSLHLHHGRLHTACFSDGLPLFPHMTRLVLQGRVEDSAFNSAVRSILEQTPNLEVLTFYMAEEKEQRKDEVALAAARDNGRRGCRNAAMVPYEEGFSTACLWQRVKEINLVHYEGNETQRMLARLLLSNTMVLERMCVVFTPECLDVQVRMKEEIEGWVSAECDCSERIFL